MTKDQVLLALVEGYQIPLLIEPVQKAPKVPKLNLEQQKTNRSGREGNAGKRSISKVCHSKGEFC